MAKIHQLKKKNRDYQRGLKKKKKTPTRCLQKPTLNIKTDRSKVKGHKKITHANTSQRKLSSYIKFEQSKLLTMNIAWV